MFAGKNRLERRVVHMFWQDGLVDLLAGAALVAIGIAWLFQLFPLGATAPGVLMLFWKPLRAKWTEPRLGYVEFSDMQTWRNQSFLVLLLMCGALVFAFVMTSCAVVTLGLRDVERWVAPALPAWILAFLLGVGATITLQIRFLGYALALVVCGTVVMAGQWEPGWALLAGGGITLVGAAITMFRFARRYPRHRISK